jgi:hypothetical protein
MKLKKFNYLGHSEQSMHFGAIKSIVLILRRFCVQYDFTKSLLFPIFIHILPAWCASEIASMRGGGLLGEMIAKTLILVHGSRAHPDQRNASIFFFNLPLLLGTWLMATTFSHRHQSCQ